MPDYVCIKTFLNRFEAELAQGLLASNGFEAVLSADDAGGMQPNLSYTNNVRLLVKESEAKEAIALLDDGVTAEA